MIEGVPPEAVAVGALVLAAITAYLKRDEVTARRKIIAAETKLRAWFRSDFSIPSPAVEEIDRATIDAALVEAIPANTVDSQEPIRTAYSDGTYLAPVAGDVPMLRTIGALTSVLPYRPERFDCENFAGAYRAFVAFLLGTNTVGVVYDWSGEHAYNVVVDADGTVRFYEPQEDAWKDLGGENYPLENALVVF